MSLPQPDYTIQCATQLPELPTCNLEFAGQV